MREKTLVMGFENESGKKFNLRVREIKVDLTKEDINRAMDAIVSNDVLVTTGGKIVKKLEANIVSEETTGIEII
ncbi:MAG: DUF2922 domain-containing protein [Clostridium chrysemydis]|uniref:DUF2922 domain-containing protein n=1 Tax=Clostridium chrysemydis TaxID=2665504 RepID=UPI003F2CEA7D